MMHVWISWHTSIGTAFRQIDLGEDGESFAFIYSIENPKGTSGKRAVGAQVRP